MPKVKPISPFYDENSAPPTFPSLLTDQLELFGNTHHSPSLLSNEILPKSKNVVHFPINNLPSKTGQGRTAQSPYPTTQPHQQLACASSHSRAGSKSPSETSQTSSLSSLSDSASDSGSTLSMLSERAMILRPPGEPGRPGRGGYNLESAVGWNHTVFSKFKVRLSRYSKFIQYNISATDFNTQAH